MKQGNNNEVDLLLRALAKGREGSALRGGSATAGGNGTVPDHLDADELNSYAEGVVPEAARARYTDHLADCDSCRRIVIDLSQAAGVAGRLEVPTQQRGAGFWQKLGVIFSPAVLRFAVPAVVLTAVIGIALLGVQQQRRSAHLARNEERANAAPDQALKQQTKESAAPSGDANVVSPATTAHPGASPPSINDSMTERGYRGEKPADAPASAAPGADFGATTAPLAKDGTLAAKSADSVQPQPSYAPEPKAGSGVGTASAPPAPAKVQSEADEVSRAAKEQPAKREAQEQARQRDDIRNQPVEEHGPNRGNAQRSGPSNSQQNNAQNLGGFRMGGGPNAEDKKAKSKPSDVEMQSVSGRTFAREGNAWVDTAYDSSRPTIKVKRGSEQFRALVADEPGLGAIANQLKGTVIVIWKNRTYRIQ